jgi:CRISPR-associated protein Csb2
MAALVIYVRLHDGRYHGKGDWPPSPARLFQALVASAGLSGPLEEGEREALKWLEGLQAPIIAAPRAWQPGRGVRFYMPNNDSDAIAGDPSRMAKIRTATKTFQPHFFDTGIPFVYAWPLGPDPVDQQNAGKICGLAEGLYQFGRGIDMAWAWGETLDDGKLEDFLAAYPGQVFRPSENGSGRMLPTPLPGSLESLERRYRAYAERFCYVKEGRKVKVAFRQPPKARFRPTPYNGPASRYIYELRDPMREGVFASWPLEGVHGLVVRLRDEAVARLKRAMPSRAADIDRVLVGRKPDGTNDCPPESRVRIIPLPSIGHVHADREIRRVLVETPPGCLLHPSDIQWAFSGLDLIDRDGDEILATLIRTDDENFLRHYGVQGDRAQRLWRTVTPAVLPEFARRRRIDPTRKVQEAKIGSERRAEQERAAAAVVQALRHAQIRERVNAIRLQREPFEANGRRAEEFAEGTRFEKHRFWHVEVEFCGSIQGPLVIGDGRFLGLGVMAPVIQACGVYAFAVESGLVASPDPENLSRALRRAVMARVQEHIKQEPMPAFFSGHEPDGSPSRAPRSSHLAFAFDPLRERLLIIAPHIVDRRLPTPNEAKNLAILDHALENFRELRAGQAGVLSLKPVSVEMDKDPLWAPSRVWCSLTPYRVTRHLRAGNAQDALARDIQTQLRLREFPDAEVTPLECEGIAGRGLEGAATLKFKVAVTGPVLLGRSRFLGGGIFAGKKLAVVESP